MSRSLLVLCHGNICRSPMAEVLLRHAFPDWQVGSAGLAAVVGAPAEPEAIQALGELGTELQDHRARQLDADQVQAADLVLTMTRAQKEEVEHLHPWARGRVFRIGEWDGFDIDDPYRLPLEAFLRVRQLLETTLASWRPRLAATPSPTSKD
jgi:protein-tyrosine phosphatase